MKNSSFKIKFLHNTLKKKSLGFEKYVYKIVKIVDSAYVLPKDIEIDCSDLDNNIYGMTYLDPRYPNRIKINQGLGIQEIGIVLIHELIHLHQIYVNKLRCLKGGIILWENVRYKVKTEKLTYNQYLDLPWEQDANNKMSTLVTFLEKYIKYKDK